MGREINFPMLGMLKSDDTFPESVFINKVSEVQFRVKALSPIPKSVFEKTKADPESVYFNGFLTNVAEWAQQKESQGAPPDVIAEKFRKFMQDKLLFFKVQIETAGHLNIAKDSIKIIQRPKEITLSSSFTMIPIVDTSEIDFQSRMLKNGQVPIGFMGLDEIGNIKDIKYLYNNNYVYGQFGENELGKMQTAIFKCKDTELKRMRWDANDKTDTVASKFSFVWENRIIFMERNCEQVLNDGEKFELFTPVEKEIVDSFKAAASGKTEAKADTVKAPEVPMVDIRNGRVKQRALKPNGAVKIEEGKLDEQAETEEMSEEQFINKLKDLAKVNNLLYDDKTLINFHTSMKTGSLLVLNGISGTGKTKLASIYKQALGLRDNQFKMVSVKPNWSDDSDVLGFMDVANNIYRPAESGVIDILRDAETNPDKIYIVCFDEMNLARVEYYFSQFLSRLEVEGKDRKIVLYNKDRQQALYNSSRYPAEIALGRNLFFIGTINIDETTQAFSDKVLDRANLIHTDVLSFKEWKENFNNKPDHVVICNEIPMTEFDSWIIRDDNPVLSDEEISLFDEMNGLLAQYTDRPIGYRVITYIDNYIKNIPQFAADTFFDRKHAIDIQIVQRILPKIRGSIGELQELIGVGNYQSKLVELLDKYGQVSGFELTRKRLEAKRKELQSHGYTS